MSRLLSIADVMTVAATAIGAWIAASEAPDRTGIAGNGDPIAATEVAATEHPAMIAIDMRWQSAAADRRSLRDQSQ